MSDMQIEVTGATDVILEADDPAKLPAPGTELRMVVSDTDGAAVVEEVPLVCVKVERRLVSRTEEPGKTPAEASVWRAQLQVKAKRV